MCVIGQTCDFWVGIDLVKLGQLTNTGKLKLINKQGRGLKKKRQRFFLLLTKEQVLPE